MREIILDTETTGLDPKLGHRIVEIGCIEMINRVKTGKIYHTYVNPERDMPPDAYRIHGISREFLKDKPIFKQIATDFFDFIDGASLVIHNAQFDVKFINHEFSNVKIKPINNKLVIDTLMIARKKFPGLPASLDALCKRFNIDLSARDKHGALLDAELLTDVYIELTGGNQKAMIFVEEKITIESAITLESRNILPVRPHNPSEEELADHKEFMSKIKKPIWAE